MLFRRTALFLLALCITYTGLAQNSSAHKVQLQRDEAEMQSYILTMDTLTRLFQANHALDEATKADPSLKQSAKDNNDDQQTLDQMSANLSKSPKVVALLAARGFTPRTFALAELAFVQASIGMMGVQMGQSVAEVARASHINPANLQLVKDHEADIKALHERYPFKMGD